MNINNIYINSFKIIIILLIFINTTYICHAAEMWGSIIDIEINKKISNLSLNLEGEYRTRENFSESERIKTTLEANYKINKYLKIGAGYSFICYNDIEKEWENRHRYFLEAIGDYNIKRFKFSLRERIQGTYREDISEYNKQGIRMRVNPKYVLRSRAKLEYDYKKSNYSPYLSTELFYTLNDIEENNIYKIRYQIGTEYKINNNNYINAFFRYTTFHNFNEDNEDDCDKIIGIGYKYKF